MSEHPHYGSVADFENFCDLRRIAIPSSTVRQEPSLLIASEWVDSRYRAYFGGEKTGGRDQVREWPRTVHYDYYGNLIPNDVIPVEILNAVYSLASRDINKPGILNIDYTPPLYESVSVDGAVAVKFATFGNVQEIQRQFQTVVDFLQPLFNRNGLNGDAGVNASGLSGPAVRV